MRTPTAIRIVVSLVFMFFGAAASPVVADPDAHDVTGTWAGFLQTDSPPPEPEQPPPEPDKAFLRVRDQRGPQFSGVFSVREVTCTVRGTISESLWMSARGACGTLSQLVIEGQARELNEFGIIQPCILQARWTLTTQRAAERGNLVLVHVEDGPRDAVAGRWEGRARHDNSEEAVAAELRARAPNEAGTGTFALGASSFSVDYVLSAPPDPERPSGFALVGGGPGGLLTLNGRYNPPPEPDRPAVIEGFHTVLRAGGGGAHGTLEIKMVASPDPD